MAEFQEVMKQAKRMCEQSEGRCGDCPLQSIENCAITNAPCFVDAETYKKIERMVMDWADKHPESRYPSWEEWWRREFPAADNAIYPCTFGIRERFACFGNGCETCRSQPIPADIAEKLGVKPVGGAE